jgi:3-oxoacyl-[acyl-carrier protein] reductase
MAGVTGAGVAGRVALVTGAGSAQGIGFASAAILAAQGARVAITSTTERIFQRRAELPGSFAFPADLTDPGQVAALVGEVEQALGPIDILVNNAGMIQTGHGEETGGAFLGLQDAQWWRGLELNLMTAVRVTRQVLPGMVARGYGRVVQVSSVTGPLVSNPGSSIYSAAKAAMTGWTRALAIEVARAGVTVNCVGPGWIATASQAPAEAEAGRATPAGRSGTPAEVGACVAFLASAEASYVTGQLLVVDGGNILQEHKGRAGPP